MSEAAAPVRKGPGVLLIVSLCLNVALLGLIAIAMVRAGERMFEPRPVNRALSAQALMRMVPAEKPKIQSIIKAHHDRLHDLRKEAMRVRAEAFEVLSSPNFTPDSFAKSLAAVQSADAALESEAMKVTGESVAALTPAERQSVAGKVRSPKRALLRRMFRHR